MSTSLQTRNPQWVIMWSWYYKVATSCKTAWLGLKLHHKVPSKEGIAPACCLIACCWFCASFSLNFKWLTLFCSGWTLNWSQFRPFVKRAVHLLSCSLGELLYAAEASEESGFSWGGMLLPNKCSFCILSWVIYGQICPCPVHFIPKEKSFSNWPGPRPWRLTQRRDREAECCVCTMDWL